MSKRKLLIVEDDPNLGQILHEFLILKGFEAVLMRDGEAGIQEFRSRDYDLCLLDIMMPKKDGFMLASEIKAANKSTPIIFLTAKNLTEDAIKGLSLGADDYITKPFSMEELVLRIQAVLRRSDQRTGHKVSDKVKIGSLELDRIKRKLHHQPGTTQLTRKEADLLSLLAQHSNETLDRNLALKTIWGDDSYFNARSMDVYIAKLRKILKHDEGVSILTDHGLGFKLVVESQNNL